MAKAKHLILVAAVSVIPTLFIWLPFFLKLPSFWGIPLPQTGMATIVANYDGPLYLVVAKTLYNPGAISQNFQFPLPTEYYASHFPLYPALIKTFSPFVGYPYSMLLITIASGILALYFFHKLIGRFVGEKEALLLTFLFSIFPARWLIVKSIGSPEPFFVATIIASLYYFQNKKYWLAGLWGALAQLTKSPGILLFIAYGLSLGYPHIKNLPKLPTVKRVYPLFLIPLALITVSLVYKFTYGDFFTYFKSGDNIHLFFPPFQIFNYSQPWVGTFWLEEIIFVYLFGVLGLLQLINQGKRELAWFVGVFFVSTIFVSHRDLIRYSLPLVPFLYIAFADFLVKREFKIATLFLILPIYLFSLAYISQNVMPISNWAPFL